MPTSWINSSTSSANSSSPAPAPALVAQRAGISELQEAASTLSRLVEEVRDSALNLRMVQIGGTFSRFQRVVRDVSKELGKDIELVISGAETELDKTVVEKIGDPLTHLVRNSMDHGIESAEVRLATANRPRARLRLNAYHDSGSIVIEVSDDGGGLKKDKILQQGHRTRTGAARRQPQRQRDLQPDLRSRASPRPTW